MEAISKNTLSAMLVISSARRGMRTFSDRGEPSTPMGEPFRKVDQIEELRRILADQKKGALKVHPTENVAYGR
jgi:hypothetical protein